MVLVDYYSNFIEVNKLASTKSSAVITCCKQQFSRYGIPDELITDNGPQFTSAEFRQFTKDYGIKHTTSSPLYPQSNGRAEKAVQTAKNLIKKAKVDKADPHLALLDYRNTPRDGLPSPAQLFLGRRTQTQLPTSAKLLEPHTFTGIPQQLHKHQMKQKYYYDQSSKPLPQLSPGDKVHVREEKTWKPVVVSSNADAPRSYIVTKPNGHTYRRNRRDLSKSYRHDQPDNTANSGQPLNSNNDNQGQIQTASSPTTTRYGRTIKLPSYLEHFVALTKQSTNASHL
ncbi:uncharacterized protein K02A2.6-like [Patiria miniata]|uniref:Integrase catalytic domain-containing protein n=1 Tax=Patiria miniata TaxID=46514 RepID=A0A914BEZ5_PATMI|nr:uncharacterized protein K02A2.6-like [Patiria miniata]